MYNVQIRPQYPVVNYSRLPGTELISGYTVGPLVVTKIFEPHRDLITQIRNETPVGIISQYDYANDALGRRVSRQDSGLAFAQPQANTFGYNHRSEVTSAVMYTNTYGYVFDPIGNRLVSSHNAETNAYTANNLNQYSNIVVQSVQSAPSVDNRVPLYDVDGNMTFDGREWHYTWNGENRMILASNAAHTVTYAYDHQGRMTFKEIFDISNNYKLETNNYTWDNWNIIAETTVSPSPIPHSSLLIVRSTLGVLTLAALRKARAVLAGCLPSLKTERHSFLLMMQMETLRNILRLMATSRRIANIQHSVKLLCWRAIFRMDLHFGGVPSLGVG